MGSDLKKFSITCNGSSAVNGCRQNESSNSWYKHHNNPLRSSLLCNVLWSQKLRVCKNPSLDVFKNIKNTVSPELHRYRFPYRENRSTEDAVIIALRTSLSHLEMSNTYVRILLVAFSSTFNTIIPTNWYRNSTIWACPHHCAYASKTF